MFPISQLHPATTMLLAWVFQHHDALLNASMLLGGRAAHRRTARLLAELLANSEVTRRIVCELSQLHALLTLERVNDPDSEEAIFFAAIDPADPVVYDLCALADGLGDRLEAIRDASGRGMQMAKAA